MNKKLLLFTMLQFISVASILSQGVSLPYITGFDSPAEKAGWQQYRTGFQSLSEWGYSGVGFSGSCVSHDYNVGGNPNDTVVDWFISPALNFTGTGQLAVKVNTSGFSTPFPDSFEILFGTDHQDPAAGNYSVIGVLSYMQPQFQWLDTTIDVPFVSDSGYIAFKYKTIGAAWSTYSFDNISITLAPVSVGESISSKTSIQCFPNPFSVSSLLVFPDEYKNSELNIQLCDVFGREVMKWKHSGSSTFQLERNNIPTGIYSLNVFMQNQHLQTLKILAID